MTSMSVLPQAMHELLRRELKPGESLVWVGQPDPNRYMKSGFKLWLFFVPWTAFSLFWIAGASGFRLPTFEEGWSYFPLFGLPFLLIGLGGLSAPWRLKRNASSIVYAVTNQRAITIEGAKSVSVKSYLPAEIGYLERTEHQDGSGDLVLRTEHYRDSKGNQRQTQHGFFAIQKVRHVEQIIESLARGAHA